MGRPRPVSVFASRGTSTFGLLCGLDFIGHRTRPRAFPIAVMFPIRAKGFSDAARSCGIFDSGVKMRAARKHDSFPRLRSYEAFTNRCICLLLAALSVAPTIAQPRRLGLPPTVSGRTTNTAIIPATRSTIGHLTRPPRRAVSSTKAKGPSGEGKAF